MRQAALALFLVSAVLALGQTPATPEQSPTVVQQLYGVWYIYPPGNPATDAVHYEFRQNKTAGKDEMIVTRACPGDYKAVTARAVSPIEVSEDSIRVIKESFDTKQAQTGSTCEAKTQAGFLSYSFSEDGTHLILTNPGGNPDIVELARQETFADTTPPQSLYGTWLLPPAASHNLQAQTRIVFYADADRQARMRQIAVCSKGNDSVVSHADANINVTKDQIIIMESASHEEPLGTMLCKASIAASTWHYVLAPGGVTMTVTPEGDKPIKLTRQRDPGLN